jgi:hypothetical protein
MQANTSSNQETNHHYFYKVAEIRSGTSANRVAEFLRLHQGSSRLQIPRYSYSPALLALSSILVPLNPGVVLKRCEPGSSDQEPDSSGSWLVTWNELNRRYKEVVKYPRDSKTRHLSLAFHHLYCFAEIHKSKVKELKQTLAVKTKWKKHNQHF